MINIFQFICKNRETFFWDIDVRKARELFKDYNIYFNYYNPKIGTHSQDFDYYILDSEKTFDEQLNIIKTLCFPDWARYFFYTDYKINKSILKRKIIEAKQNLDKKNKTYSISNIHNETKIKKSILVSHFQDLLEKNQPTFKFD